MIKPRLKPCPFCGSKNFEVGIADHLENCPAYRYSGRCYDCLTDGPLTSSEDKAVAAWNRRKPDWERKWGELIETTAARTDQAKVKK